MTAPLSSGRALAWATPVAAEAAALGRSIAFAWALGPDELGKAMMLALTVRLVEMASDVGVDRLIVQAPDGNAATLQSNLQGVMIARGFHHQLYYCWFGTCFGRVFCGWSQRGRLCGSRCGAAFARFCASGFPQGRTAPQLWQDGDGRRGCHGGHGNLRAARCMVGK